MSTQVTPIEKAKHKNTRIKASALKHAAESHFCPANAHEFPQLAGEFPIVFVKNSETGSFHAVAVMGLKSGENLFLQNDQWQANYIPATLRAYPFLLAKVSEDSEQMAICLDGNSDLVVDGGDAGNPLFNEDGSDSEFFTNISDFLTKLVAHGNFTNDFSQYLADKDLLIEQAIQIKQGDGKEHSVTGVFRIDETKLNALSNEDFIELREKNYLPAIYAHLASLIQVKNLGRLNSKKTAN